MLFKLAWSILGARRFKFVQMKCPERGIFFKIFWTSRSNAKVFGMDHPKDM